MKFTVPASVLSETSCHYELRFPEDQKIRSSEGQKVVSAAGREIPFTIKRNFARIEFSRENDDA